jgi:hypothetical protein
MFHHQIFSDDRHKMPAEHVGHYRTRRIASILDVFINFVSSNMSEKCPKNQVIFSVFCN